MIGKGRTNKRERWVAPIFVLRSNKTMWWRNENNDDTAQ
jgi:hypothetical protein